MMARARDGLRSMRHGRVAGCLALALSLMLGLSQDRAVAAEHDLVVYGGTSAGVIAAVQARRMGKSVVLVCPDKHLGGYINGSTVNMTIGSDAQRFTGAYVTDGFMKALGVAPVMGRDFTPEDNTPGAPKVTIIGHELWQRNFAGASDIIGRSVRLNGKPATVIGVMAPGFAFPQNEQLRFPLL